MSRLRAGDPIGSNRGMHTASRDAVESPYAWSRLALSLLLMTIGGSGM